jgi:CheY-like chemotaxis protein
VSAGYRPDERTTVDQFGTTSLAIASASTLYERSSRTGPVSYAREVSEHVGRAGTRPGPILIVDDYADARATLREVLEDMGQEVIEAGNGQEAFDFLVFHPDVRVQLILLDLEMPRMTGLELLALLKSYVRLASIPVLVISRHTASLRPRDYRMIHGYLEAPRDIPRLRELVEAIVRH